MCHSVTAASLIVLILACTPTAEGQCRAEETAEIAASARTDFDNFGACVSIAGDVAVIGAPGDGHAGAGSGAAYIYRFDGFAWNEEARLTAADASAGDFFGASVSLSGNVVVIGAWGDDPAELVNAGSAHVFRFDGQAWDYEQTLSPADREALDRFGWSVAVDGESVVVTALDDDDHGPSSGAAYVFGYVDGVWIESAKLTASDAEAGDQFGSAAAIDGDTILVGAWRTRDDDGGGPDSGAAYAFRYDGTVWLQDPKITAAASAGGDEFGVAVAISGDLALIGAHELVNGGPGSAYVFRREEATWVQEARLTASDGAALDRFGRSLSVAGGTIAIGAPGSDRVAVDSGAAYIYRYDGDGWIERASLAASNAADGSLFGSGVAVHGATAVIGAPLDDDAGTDPGSAYAFHGLSDCNGNGTLDICDLAQGTSQDCNLNGMPDECDIASGRSDDCNENALPDECEIGVLFESESAELSPIGSGAPQSHTIIAPPPVTGGDVTLAFRASADFSSPSEFVTVDINGLAVGTAFKDEAGDCPELPDQDEIIISAAVFQSAVAGGDAVINMIATTAVNPNLCDPPSFITVTLSYESTDCNNNGVLDECDIADGTSRDENANGIPDECECDPCDADCDGDADAFDIEPFLELLFDGGQPCGVCSGDVDGNGVIDAFDIEPFLECLFP